MTKLGRSVDELEVDLLKSPLLGVSQEALPQSENSLFGPNAAALDHDEVLLHFSVVREATHGIDRLVSNVILSSSVVLDQLPILHLVFLSQTVNLLVDLRPVMVALLSSPGDSGLDPAGMPGSDTGHLPQTLVSLPRQLLGTPPAGHALVSVSLGHSNDVNHLILSEHV